MYKLFFIMILTVCLTNSAIAQFDEDNFGESHRLQNFVKSGVLSIKSEKIYYPNPKDNFSVFDSTYIRLLQDTIAIMEYSFGDDGKSLLERISYFSKDWHYLGGLSFYLHQKKPDEFDIWQDGNPLNTFVRDVNPDLISVPDIFRLKEKYEYDQHGRETLRIKYFPSGQVESKTTFLFHPRGMEMLRYGRSEYFWDIPDSINHLKYISDEEKRDLKILEKKITETDSLNFTDTTYNYLHNDTVWNQKQITHYNSKWAIVRTQSFLKNGLQTSSSVTNYNSSGLEIENIDSSAGKVAETRKKEYNQLGKPTLLIVERDDMFLKVEYKYDANSNVIEKITRMRIKEKETNEREIWHYDSKGNPIEKIEYDDNGLHKRTRFSLHYY
jgi:hypothetical protein